MDLYRRARRHHERGRPARRRDPDIAEIPDPIALQRYEAAFALEPSSDDFGLEAHKREDSRRAGRDLVTGDRRKPLHAAHLARDVEGLAVVAHVDLRRLAPDVGDEQRVTAGAPVVDDARDDVRAADVAPIRLGRFAGRDAPCAAPARQRAGASLTELPFAVDDVAEIFGASQRTLGCGRLCIGRRERRRRRRLGRWIGVTA